MVWEPEPQWDLVSATSHIWISFKIFYRVATKHLPLSAHQNWEIESFARQRRQTNRQLSAGRAELNLLKAPAAYNRLVCNWFFAIFRNKKKKKKISCRARRDPALLYPISCRHSFRRPNVNVVTAVFDFTPARSIADCCNTAAGQMWSDCRRLCYRGAWWRELKSLSVRVSSVFTLQHFSHVSVSSLGFFLIPAVFIAQYLTSLNWLVWLYSSDQFHIGFSLKSNHEDFTCKVLLPLKGEFVQNVSQIKVSLFTCKAAGFVQIPPAGQTWPDHSASFEGKEAGAAAKEQSKYE